MLAPADDDELELGRGDRGRAQLGVVATEGGEFVRGIQDRVAGVRDRGAAAGGGVGVVGGKRAGEVVFVRGRVGG